jgi:hypothetical protein
MLGKRYVAIGLAVSHLARISLHELNHGNSLCSTSGPQAYGVPSASWVNELYLVSGNPLGVGTVASSSRGSVGGSNSRIELPPHRLPGSATVTLDIR